MRVAGWQPFFLCLSEGFSRFWKAVFSFSNYFFRFFAHIFTPQKKAVSLHRKSDKRRFPALGVENDLTEIFDKDGLIFFFKIFVLVF